MAARALAHPIVHFTFTAFVAWGLLLCLYPGFFPSYSWVSNYAVQIMLLYLGAGIFFLLLKQPRLTFVSFGACLILSLFLKFSIKNDDIQRWRETVIRQRLPLDEREKEEELKTPFKIAHFNTSNATDVSSTIHAMREANADLLSVHEVTPQWDEWLKDSLSRFYPYHHSLVDIGLFGMAVYSKMKLEFLDTFYYRDIPNLIGSFTVDGEKLFFLSVHTEPAVNFSSSQRLREHLGDLAGLIRERDVPILVFGDFNAVSWSNDINLFCDGAGLMESRTGFLPHASGGITSLFEIPLDHIFYSRHLHCAGFQNLTNGYTTKRLGISGIYRLKPFNGHAKKTSR